MWWATVELNDSLCVGVCNPTVSVHNNLEEEHTIVFQWNCDSELEATTLCYLLNEAFTDCNSEGWYQGYQEALEDNGLDCC